MFAFAQLLTQSVVGGTREQGEEEEGDATGHQEGSSGPDSGCYEVVGSLQEPSSGKPDWASEVVEVSWQAVT